MSNAVHPIFITNHLMYDVTPTSANISEQEHAVLKPWKLSIANDWEIKDWKWKWIFCLLFLTNHLQLPKTNFQRTTQIGLTCQQLQPRITKTTNYIYNFDPFPLVNGFLQSPQVSLHSSKPDVIFWAGYRAIEQSETQIQIYQLTGRCNPISK